MPDAFEGEPTHLRARAISCQSQLRPLFFSMRELRIQHAGKPYRVLYAFDPRRTAILLIGGNKTGKDRWYIEFVPIADALYDRHIRVLKKKGK